VENAGFGATWAAPIASLLIEKYLTDSLRADRVKEVERIASQNLMPSWLKREQYKADSARAYYYFKLTKDSAYLKRFFHRNIPVPKNDSVKTIKKDTAKTMRLALLKHSRPEPGLPVSQPDSNRVGYIHRDELWDEQVSAKKRRTLV